MTEKRQSPRVSFACEVECSGVGMGLSPLNPRISDISASGAFIDSITHIPEGSKVKVKFMLGGREISATAEIAHSMPQFGMGIRFLDLSEENRKAIEQFVASR